MNEAREIAEKLSEAQRRALQRAYPLSGPSGDCYVYGRDFDALWDSDEDLVTGIGRLTNLGLQVRAILNPETSHHG